MATDGLGQGRGERAAHLDVDGLAHNPRRRQRRRHRRRRRQVLRFVRLQVFALKQCDDKETGCLERLRRQLAAMHAAVVQQTRQQRALLQKLGDALLVQGVHALEDG